jgi:hypothetical protein
LLEPIDEQRQFVNPSDDALRECLAYRYHASGHAEHPHDTSFDDLSGAKINHGDRVIADGLDWMLCKKLGIVSQRPSPPPDTGPPEGSLAYRRLQRKQEDSEEDVA